MRNVLIPVLSVVVLVLLFQLHSQSSAIKELQRQTALPVVPSLELQEKCARQSAEEFKQEGLSTSGMAEFTNHYSSKMGRCFVVTKGTGTTGNLISTHKVLVDAYEGKVYGSYEWMNRYPKR